jgi:hypothetical protein
VGIDDIVDSARRSASGLQTIEEIGLQLVPSRYRDTLLPVSDTGINDDLLIGDNDQERLNQSPPTTILIHEIGYQPGVAGEISKIKFGNKTQQRGRGIQLRNTKYRGITNLPAENLDPATFSRPMAGRVSRPTQLA